MRKYAISGVPVTVDGKLVGIITNRDMRFENELNKPIGEVMTKENLVTAPVGTSLEEAKANFCVAIVFEKITFSLMTTAILKRFKFTIKDIEKSNEIS